jgi:hypothetical protein
VRTRLSDLCALVALAIIVIALLSACEGCKDPKAPLSKSDATPTARLYLISDLAGALEPCGCVKDQLGGMDHFGALVATEKKDVTASAVLAAGPLFFMDAEVSKDKLAQEVSKAETIASALRTLGLAGFAPSRNEWAAGGDVLAKLRDTSAAPALAANVTAGVPLAKHVTKELGGIKIGFIGVAAPDKAKSTAPGVTSSAPAEAVKEAATAAKKEGARALVVLAAVGRGEAKRIADANPDVLAVVVGSTGASGDLNTKAAPAERVGDVLVVETANHLQTVAILDLHVRDARGDGLLKLADGTGIERTRKREELARRIDELRTRIATWETDKSVDPKDVAARKDDVAKLEAERAELDKAPPPAEGSFYRYAMRDIRESLGAHESVKAQMLAYYKKVNDANKLAFADKLPAPVAKGGSKFVGTDVCATCHEDPKRVWDGTAHAHAYATLEKQFKEFNLDCVNCHVTGYDLPGGSTVTHVADLKDVQCEVCHGAGQLHATKPDKNKIPIAKPSPDSCTTCHHPPHVHTFDAKAKMADILGPGHGKPK